MIFQQTPVGEMPKALNQAQDVAFITILFIIMVLTMSTLLQITSTTSSRSKEPFLKSLLGWLYGISIGALIERKRYRVTDFGRFNFTAQVSAEVKMCVHCEQESGGLISRYGQHYVVAGFVAYERIQGEVEVCETCHEDPIEGMLAASGGGAR